MNRNIVRFDRAIEIIRKFSFFNHLYFELLADTKYLIIDGTISIWCLILKTYLEYDNFYLL